jgi:hypothetical protein
MSKKKSIDITQEFFEGPEENLEDGISVNPYAAETAGPTKKLGDKIFGAHNNPNAGNEYNENFGISSDSDMLEGTYDEEEYLHRKKLEETVFECFQKSRWYPLSYKKKIPKDLIPHLFQDVLEGLEGTEFSFSEKFVVICDFVNIPYLKAYEIIPPKYKEKIINELETKFSVLSKRKTKKLF